VLSTILASLLVFTFVATLWTSGMYLGYIFSPGIVARIFPRHSKSGGLLTLEVVFLLITGSIVLFNALFSSVILTALSVIFYSLWYGVKRRSRKESRSILVDTFTPISLEAVKCLVLPEHKKVSSDVGNFDEVFTDLIYPK
jgi:hypothetical protein